MIWGFTGSRHGMTAHQKQGVRAILRKGDNLHHGRCVGGDEEADAIAKSVGCYRVAHPGPVPALTADTDSEEVREPKPFHERNRDVVDEGYALIAAPRTLHEVLGNIASVLEAKLDTAAE